MWEGILVHKSCRGGTLQQDVREGSELGKKSFKEMLRQRKDGEAGHSLVN